MIPFEWDVGVSSKDHTVTALTSYDEPATAGYTTLRGTIARTSGVCRCDAWDTSTIIVKQLQKGRASG
jgi:hypothetical protein